MSARPVRVLFVEVAYGGHGADYSVHTQLIEALSASASLEVMSLSHPDLAAQRPDEAYRVPCLAYDFGERASRRRLSVVLDLPRAIRDALPAIRAFEPDVIYSSQLRRDAMAAHMISAVTRVPQAVHLHYSFGPWLGRAAVLTIRRARHVIAVSEYVRQTALLRGMPEERVTTVPNLTSTRPSGGPGRAVVRAELGIGEDDVVVIAVGRIDRGKGISDLIDAADEVRAHHSALRVLVCGQSNHSPGLDIGLRDRVVKRGLGDVVQMLGQRSDVASLLGASDVFCLPSSMEPFGLVFIEAMKAGLPVVALRSGGVPEIVIEGVTGLLSYPRDSAGLAENLRAVVGDPELRERFGTAGRDRLATHFDNERTAQRWLSTLTRVLR